MPATALTKVGGPGYRGPNTYSAPAAPTTANDVTTGIKEGDRVINHGTTPREVYVATNPATGEWVKVSN